jgi:hypothetical protein
VPDSIDTAERKRAMAQLEQYVAVSIQGERIDEADLMSRLKMFNAVVNPSLPDSDLETIARRLAEQLPIDMDLGSVITSADYEPWLKDRKQDIDWGRWLAYKTLLIQQRRAPTVIDRTDELTDEILDLAGDPTEPGPWKRRGLVLGDVQSGKTGTYLALFNKAADAGYRLFILLAGNTEVLRQQTQVRVDEAFIGRDSSNLIPRKGSNVTPRKHIGVGLIRKDLAQGTGMTTVIRDFRRSSYEASNIAIQTNSAHPYVFVIKKNKNVLEALIAWLNEQSTASGGMLSVPVLMLDDESDFASINTKSETDPTSMNKAIRDVLALFSRSSYVAFTATPFANIFVDHGVDNDIFPRNFVYSLDAPTNYVGSIKTFGTTEVVRTDGLADLTDVEGVIPLGHKSSLRITALPGSLTDATDTFLVSNAIRDLRGDADQPRAMLVNVSRFRAVQRQVFDLLARAVAETKTAVELHYADAATEHSVIRRLERRFEAEYAKTGVAWSEVLQRLPKAIADVRVRLFNSDTDKRLQEEDEQWARPTRMIAVGGDVLSRGLTLEGLCVSYFYRRVSASDTLMQMARWFGYRDGYEDLCRIWINAESADNYRFAADSIDELRTDLRLMLRQNFTPEDFGLAVRKHPGALLITARNKMKNAQEVSRTIGLAGRRLETTTLLRNHAQNRAALKGLIETIDSGDAYVATRNGWNRWLSIDKGVVGEFLREYGEWAPRSDPFFSGTTLSNWVRTAKAEKFGRWDVVLANGRIGAVTITIGRRHLPLPQRVLRRDGELLRVSGSSRRLAGPTDLGSLLDRETRKRVEAEYKVQEPAKSPSEWIYYPHLERPALIVYPLGSAQPKEGADGGEQHDVVIGKDDYLVALKVAIPGDSTRVRDGEGDVTYVINTVAQQYWLSEFSDSEDEDLDD